MLKMSADLFLCTNRSSDINSLWEFAICPEGRDIPLPGAICPAGRRNLYHIATEGYIALRSNISQEGVKDGKSNTRTGSIPILRTYLNSSTAASIAEAAVSLLFFVLGYASKIANCICQQ